MADPTRARRLRPQDRERQIVQGAIAFFAEVGLDGHTRELARRLGITQPLLYRYFPSKEDLIERIYQEVYLRRWKPEWEAVIADRGLPCIERFRRFESDYQRVIHDYAWLRIFVSAGMKGYDLPRRYLGMVRERVFAPLLAEMRREYALPAPDALPLGEGEFELLFGIHGALVYVGLRGLVYGLALPEDPVATRAALLDSALVGLRQAHCTVVRRALEAAFPGSGPPLGSPETEQEETHAARRPSGPHPREPRS
ncbi:MAG: TetR/AcrR family transcriptional regulator [Methylobacterium sp.]|uniref:TetR/AcrR family transcriptional regulator n=1 Tax=Methylobacterium sp. TaxID=409 RepID=UPI0025831F1D|nr:TetR/AcrR family transcriptional regulator [Methylobacterium sp.]MBY0297380.1 TetR/AcrR family transcriptional regulator [Methylobacterium sp.]